jgi:hypothetical protein
LIGRWVITSRGIYHRFGKSPARFVAWSDVHAVRYDDQKRQIILETADTPFVITRYMPESVKTSVLPFLNKLIEFLEPFPITIEPLLVLQKNIRRRFVVGQYCSRSQIIEISTLPLFGGAAMISVVLLLKKWYEFGIGPKVGVSWFVIGTLCVLTLFAFVLWQQVRRYHQQKVEKIYQSLLSGERMDER